MWRLAGPRARAKGCLAGAEQRRARRAADPVAGERDRPRRAGVAAAELQASLADAGAAPFFFFWAVLWVAMLFSVAGHDQNTWYLVAVRMAGILHNVAVAGITRAPAAYGIDLRLKETIMEDKVMACLGSTEEAYPMARPFSSGDFLPWKAVSARAVVVGVC